VNWRLTVGKIGKGRETETRRFSEDYVSGLTGTLRAQGSLCKSLESGLFEEQVMVVDISVKMRPIFMSPCLYQENSQVFRVSSQVFEKIIRHERSNLKADMPFKSPVHIVIVS
jgi:hypothetical protein